MWHFHSVIAVKNHILVQENHRVSASSADNMFKNDAYPTQ
jgi:hypothetical protein